MCSFAASCRSACRIAKPQPTTTCGRCAFMSACARLVGREVLMRSALLLPLVALVAACGAPAYQAPTVRVAPSYGVMARESSARSQDSVTTASRTGVVQRTSSSTAPSDGAESAQYSTAISSTPFWKELG